MYCPSKVHLCIDTRMAFSSGVGTFIREVIPLFSKHFFRVTLLNNHLWSHPWEEIPFDAPIYSIQEQRLFSQKIPSCDWFWSPHYNVPFFPIRAKKRAVTIHDVCHIACGGWKQKLYAQIMMRKALKSDVVVTISEFSKKETQAAFGEKQIHIIPIGVNPNVFKKRTGAREKYLIPKRYILFVGSAKKHKNLIGLFHAFHQLNMADVHLVLVGKDLPERGRNILSLQEVSNEDLAALYSEAEALVFPSLYEGFGLPPLEAMSCGCPTIVSNVASIPEVCGDASFYFNPYEEKSLLHALRTVLSSPEIKKKLIERGFQRAQQFRWEQTAKQYMELFLQ